MNDWIRRFLRDSRAERNFSAHTLRAYAKDLGEFAAFAAESSAAGTGTPDGLRPESLDRRLVRAYLARLQARRLQRSSLLRKVSSLRSFCRWLRASGALRADPFLNVPVPKKQRRLPRFLSEAEVRTLLAAGGGAAPSRRRDRAIVELLYSCGLRRAEAAGLDVADVDFIGGTVRVFGKGARERIVPAGGAALAALRDYLAIRRAPPRPAPSPFGGEGKGEGIFGRNLGRGEPLFLNARGGRLSEAGIALVVRRWAKSARFLKPVSPHAFRHSFATHLVDRGCDLRSVQEMLGHRSLSSTQVYTHTSLERLKTVYRKCHPRGGPGS